MQWPELGLEASWGVPTGWQASHKTSSDQNVRKNEPLSGDKKIPGKNVYGTGLGERWW